MAKQVYTLKNKKSGGAKRVIAKAQNYEDEHEVFDMMCALIHVFCKKNRHFKSYYMRFYNSKTETIFDVGSHTEFFHVTPPLDLNLILF